jgi:EF hand domain-containing protein
MKLNAAFALCLAIALAACAGDEPRRGPRERGAPFHPPIELLERYDTNHDDILTRAELEAGLKADFDAADTNHDGRLDPDEVRAVNEKRWADGLSTTTAIIDWNHDGYVDFNEFAAAPRSLFEQLDVNGDGKLEPKEWKPVKPKRKHGDADDDDDDGSDGPPNAAPNGPPPGGHSGRPH